jgi:phosphatidylglycerol:prolipoprotein diacylglycerol transferase
MYPIVKISQFSIPTYWLLYVIAYIGLVSLIFVQLKRKKEIFWIALIIFFSGLTGTKLYGILTEVPIRYILQNPLMLTETSGYAFHGAIITYIICIFILYRQDFWRMMDITVAPLSLAISIGKLGCFFGGCCYGKPTSLPWGVNFPFLSVTVHPTQIYESLIMFLIFIFLLLAKNKFHIEGYLFSIFLFLYGLEKFFLEFIRIEKIIPSLGLTVAQVVSIIFIVFAIYRLFFLMPSSFFNFLFNHSDSRSIRKN